MENEVEITTTKLHCKPHAQEQLDNTKWTSCFALVLFGFYFVWFWGFLLQLLLLLLVVVIVVMVVVCMSVFERDNVKFGGQGDEKNLGGAEEGKEYGQNVLYEKQLRNGRALALQALKDSNCHPRLL